jgi:hypothetical protein
VVIPDGLTETQAAVLDAASLYQCAISSGRDDDLRAAEDFASAALDRGTVHDDLLLTLAQLKLDSHDLDAATALLEQCRYSGGTHSAQAMRAAVLQQRGEAVTAAQLYASLLTGELTWRYLAGLAGVYADLDDVVTADALYHLAEDDIDAKQLTAFAWIEVRRAELFRRAGSPDRAVLHVERASAACADWRVEAERARCALATDDLDTAATAAAAVMARTGRPDHIQLLADALARAGDAAAAEHYDTARAAFAAAAPRWPWRYVHHEAELCLTTGDLGDALRLAERDFAHRPHCATGRLLATVLVACGETARADALQAQLESDRTLALETLRSQPVLTRTS